MTAPAIIRQRRQESLSSLENTLSQLVGVTAEHLEALDKAVGRTGYPPERDQVLQQAYLAAALNALASALYEAQNPTP